MAFATARRLNEGAIPVVDISALRDHSDTPAVAKALYAASTHLGFIYVKGHGIPDNVIDAARHCAYRFFRQSDEYKAPLKISSAHRGWISMGGAKMQDDARSDLKESLVWGMDYDAGQAPDEHPLRGDNQWPADNPQLPGHSMAWFHAAHRTAHDLLRGFAVGLGLDEQFFLRSVDKPLSRASYVYYPAQDEAMGVEQFGVGPHTDFGVLTLLCQDDTGGLQVQDLNGDWLEAPPVPGTLVVNVADLLSRWTDGAFKSTPHRVVNSSGRERLSLVLAFDPNPDTIIDSRQVFGSQQARGEPPVTCGDYLLWRFGKAFSYRRDST